MTAIIDDFKRLTDLASELRMALIRDMMASGEIVTPIEYLENPALLVMEKSNITLKDMHKKLMRTRRREIAFSLNGRRFFLKRKHAIDLIVKEMKGRGK